MSVDSLVQFLLQAILYWGGYNHWTGTTGLNYWTHLNCKIHLIQCRTEAKHTYSRLLC